VQSLLLVNSQLMLKRAAAFAHRLEREEPSDASRRIALAYRLVFGREATPAEIESAKKFLQAQAQRIEPEEAGSAQAAFLYGKIPYRDGQAALCDPEGPQRSFRVAHHASMPSGNFTIEAFVLPRSIYETGQVRAVAAKWDGDNKLPGWLFGVTGRGSRRKPQTLVLQMHGRKLDGTFGEQAIFSDQHIQLDKPYYLAAALKLATSGKPGTVTFYVKDLSNDDEPLLMAKVEHSLAGGFANQQPLGIGGLSGGTRSFFDGLVDNVRLSAGALAIDQLLFTSEGATQQTVGYWEFEPRPDVLGDSSGHALAIQHSRQRSSRHVNLEQAALADFCHVLMNSSEFLYVE